MRSMCYSYCVSLQMIAKHGRFVEYSVFGKETSVDWTVISDSKGESKLRSYTPNL